MRLFTQFYSTISKKKKKKELFFYKSFWKCLHFTWIIIYYYSKLKIVSFWSKLLLIIFLGRRIGDRFHKSLQSILSNFLEQERAFFIMLLFNIIFKFFCAMKDCGIAFISDDKAWNSFFNDTKCQNSGKIDEILSHIGLWNLFRLDDRLIEICIFRSSKIVE